MAVGTDFDGDLVASGAGLEGVPATAGDQGLFIVGMDVFLHGAGSLAMAPNQVKQVMVEFEVKSGPLFVGLIISGLTLPSTDRR
jgi:hypothetical protein